MPQSKGPSAEVLKALETAPSMYLVLDPQLNILTASDLYLSATETTRETIAGKYIFDAFPANPDLPDADGVQNINASLQEVLRTKKPHYMSIQRYDVPHLTIPGKFIQRYWDPSHTPVLNEDGEIQYIIQLATNVTEKILAEQALAKSSEQLQKLNAELKDANLEIDIANHELEKMVKALHVANENLEGQVRERTLKIAETNKELIISNEDVGAANTELIAVNRELKKMQASLLYLNDQLYAGEAKYRSLIEDSPIAQQAFRGPDMTFEIVNESMLQFLGKDASIIGKPLFVGVPEIVGQPIVELLYQVYHTGEPLEIKAIPVTLNRNGKDESGYYDVTYRALYDDGKVTGVLGIAIDVSEQMKLNQEIKESEERFRNMAEGTGVMIAVSDENFNATYFNNAWVQLTGLTDQYLLTGWQELLHPEDRAHALKVYDDAFNSKISFEDEYRILSNDGSYRYILVKAKTRFRADGSFAGYISSSIDVTEQIKAREQLKESEEKLQQLADNISQLAWMTDDKGYIFWYNKRWYDYTGTTLEEMKGWGWQKVHDPELVESVTSKFKEYVEKGEIWEDTFPIRGKNGEYRWFLSRAVPLKGDDGKIIRWIGTNTDVTEHKQDDQRKNDFIGMVSHELKTPLTSLNACIQMLHRKARDSQDSFTQGALEMAKKQVNKMTTMINGFLNVSRLESGKIHIDKQRFNMADLVRETEEETRMVFPSNNIIFEPVQPAYITADKDKIGQVINNFISNAVKYSPQGGTIQVSCVTVGKVAQVAVKDQGLGIKEQDTAKLFDRYYRVQGNQNISGFGIGLYLSAEIIARHNGRIWVESEPGKGSTFYFSLPLSSK